MLQGDCFLFIRILLLAYIILREYYTGLSSVLIQDAMLTELVKSLDIWRFGGYWLSFHDCPCLRTFSTIFANNFTIYASDFTIYANDFTIYTYDYKNYPYDFEIYTYDFTTYPYDLEIYTNDFKIYAYDFTIYPYDCEIYTNDFEI